MATAAQGNWGGKIPGAVIRIAGLLHVAKLAAKQPWRYEISAETMAAAIPVGAALAVHALIAFDAMGKEPELENARIILDWIRRENLTTFSRRMLTMPVPAEAETFKRGGQRLLAGRMAMASARPGASQSGRMVWNGY